MTQQSWRQITLLYGATNRYKYIYQVISRIQVIAETEAYIVIAYNYMFKQIRLIVLRGLNKLVLFIFYRMSVSGESNIPQNGCGALLVCNHVSFLDACLILASIRRPVKFLIDKAISEQPFVKSIVHASGVIPIEAGGRRNHIEEALAQAADCIAAGELVCIFAEGGITRLGILQPFRKGIARIMRDLDHDIIPLYIDEMWASIFGFKGGKFFWKLPRLRPEVLVNIGKPIPGRSTIWEVRKSVQSLGMKSAKTRRGLNLRLGDVFIKRVLRSPFASVNFSEIPLELSILRLFSLARRLAQRIDRSCSKNVGIHTDEPLSIVVAYLAIALSGKTGVRLTTTALSNDLLLSELGIEQILIGEDVSQALKVDLPTQIIGVTCDGSILYDYLCAFTRRLCLSKCSNDEDQASEVAAIVLDDAKTTSVDLTHRGVFNILHEIADYAQIPRNTTVFCSQSFTTTAELCANLWFPLLSACRCIYSSESSNSGVSESFGQYVAFECSRSATENGARVCSLKLEIKLPTKNNDGLRRKIEFFGFGNAAAFVTVKQSDFLGKDARQRGFKEGSIGHPIASALVWIADVENGELLPPGDCGILGVEGPSVFREAFFFSKQEPDAMLRAVEDSDGFIFLNNN